MDEKLNSIIKEYLGLVKVQFPEIGNVYLFGSYAKGQSNENSDIDIALIFSSLDDSKRFNVQVQLMLLASQVDTRIEPHPISLDDFNTDNPFVVEIKNSGIELAA